MANCLIALGSNLGDSPSIMEFAFHSLNSLPGSTMDSRSELYRTEPIGGNVGQNAFLNAVACLQTELPPHELLCVLQQIERSAGRTRAVRWGSRTLDLDILLYDDLQLETPQLTIPHIRMCCRQFVLEPAAEIRPNWKHPTIGWPLKRLLDHLLHEPPRFCLTGFQLAGRDDLVRIIATESKATCLDASDDFKENPKSCADLTLLQSPAWQQAERPVISGFCFHEIALHQTQLIPIAAAAEHAEFAKLYVTWKHLIGKNEIQRETLSQIRDFWIKNSVRPVLNLDTNDEDWVIRECVAAIQAMS